MKINYSISLIGLLEFPKGDMVKGYGGYDGYGGYGRYGDIVKSSRRDLMKVVDLLGKCRQNCKPGPSDGGCPTGMYCSATKDLCYMTCKKGRILYFNCVHRNSNYDLERNWTRHVS